MKDDSCIFCKLANGEISTNTLYENERFRVILDASPAAEGHALVIPKEHFANAFEIDDETVAEAAQIAKKGALKMKDVLKPDGINILQNNGEAAGQTVFHYHIHVIPRYVGDDKDVSITWKQNEFTEEEMENIRESLKLE